MTESGLEGVLRRDRAIVLAALAAIAALAWVYLLWFEAAMDMPSMPAAAAGMAKFDHWSVGGFLLMFLMWSVMMVGMMTPSAAPMILIYARVARQAEGRGRPFAAAGWFTSGYLLAWAGFALAATWLQWLLEQALLLTPMMASASPLFGGALLIAVGLYQWTPLKDACLAQCRSPLLFVQRHGGFRGDRAGAVALGLRHGLYCIGCCWGLMLLLFLGGVMNLLWIAALAALVLAEKLLPAGRLLARASGLAFVAAGAALAADLV
jgi:predicted metal-binding membrane protein